jgi:hypothetical protein
MADRAVVIGGWRNTFESDRGRMALHVDQAAVGAGALGERGCAHIPREHVWIAMHVETAGLGRIHRIIPGAGREHDDAWPDPVRDHGARKHRAAVVEHADDVAIGNASGLGIAQIDADQGQQVEPRAGASAARIMKRCVLKTERPARPSRSRTRAGWNSSSSQASWRSTMRRWSRRAGAGCPQAST